MSKHAPGTWSIQGQSVMSIDHGTQYEVARVHNEKFTEEANRANRVLIKSAPDLLDSLKAAVARVEIANAEGNPILSAWLPDAKALIAHADGATVSAYDPVEKTYLLFGRKFKVKAVFENGEIGRNAANVYMAINPGASVLAVTDSVYIADRDDLGELVRG